MKNTHVLLIKFKNKISDDEVQFFRSSIIQKLGDQPDILYHNHVEKNKYYFTVSNTVLQLLDVLDNSLAEILIFGLNIF